MLARYVTRRQVYRFEVQLKYTLDLCDSRVWKGLSLEDAPYCFLDKATARATAMFVRKTTKAEAIFVPSAAFLDQLDESILVVFLKKLPNDTRTFLPSVMEDGEFGVRMSGGIYP